MVWSKKVCTFILEQGTMPEEILKSNWKYCILIFQEGERQTSAFHRYFTTNDQKWYLCHKSRVFELFEIVRVR